MDSKLRCVFELPSNMQPPQSVEAVTVQEQKEGPKSSPKVLFPLKCSFLINLPIRWKLFLAAISVSYSWLVGLATNSALRVLNLLQTG